MKNRTAPWLAIVAALGLAGCESSSTPVAPTTGPATVDGGTTFIGQVAEGPDIVIQRCDLDIGKGPGLWSGEIRLYGSRGFSLTASVDEVDGLVRARACLGWTCLPGTPIPLYASWMGSALRSATVTLDGETYTNVGSEASTPTAGVHLGGSDPLRSETVLAPPLTKSGTDQVRAPFTVSGHFAYREGSVGFAGVGVVTLGLEHASGSAGWAVERLRYKCKHQSDRDTQ
jgi:hypothetical protein